MTEVARYTPEFYLRNQRESRRQVQSIVALVRAQEHEKERKFVMRYVRDPEDHTLWRWVPIKKRKRINKVTLL